jgi:hypothetical protein
MRTVVIALICLLGLAACKPGTPNVPTDGVMSPQKK